MSHAEDTHDNLSAWWSERYAKIEAELAARDAEIERLRAEVARKNALIVETLATFMREVPKPLLDAIVAWRDLSAEERDYASDYLEASIRSAFEDYSNEQNARNVQAGCGGALALLRAALSMSPKKCDKDGSP